MARIRTIKPEFFTSEDIVSLTPLARLFYVSLWCESDREGRLEWKPRTFKLRYLPGDDCNIEDLGQELIDAGLVVLYEADGKLYAEIPSFKKHQVINNREAESDIPARVEGQPHAYITRESGVIAERKGKEGKGKEGREEREDGPPAAQPDPTPTKPKAPRASRLPTDWKLPAEWEAWALAEHPSWTPEGVRHVADRFRDYWLAQGGANARKVDWQATWRNWVRREKSPGLGFAPAIARPAPMNRQEALEARNREVAAQLARTL